MPPAAALVPPPYHREITEYLRTHERALWEWFASSHARADYTETLRLGLLKSTYRLDATTHGELYRGAGEAAAALGLALPVTIYQAQQTRDANAALYFIPGEAHLVLSGPLLALLSPAEMTAVLGHELAHHALWQQADGAFLVAERLLQALAEDPRAHPSHVESARRYRLYTEIFADRGALAVSGALEPVVAGLVKIQTGLAQVSAAGYLAQAEDIVARGAVKSDEVSHPEAFIRARALRLWQERGAAADAEIAGMIEGRLALDDLDLLGQVRLCALTCRLLAQLLRPAWFRTDAVLGHARLFSPDVQPATADDPALIAALAPADARVREYLCYVLLDFAAADAELDDLPLAATWQWSRRLGLAASFEALLVKELGLEPRTVRKLTEQAAELLERAER